jgi:hypothetical protein
MNTHLTARVLRVWKDRRKTKWQGMIGLSSTHSVGLTDGRCNGRRNLRRKCSGSPMWFPSTPTEPCEVIELAFTTCSFK